MFSTDKNYQVREYPVIKDFGDNESFFRLQTESGEVQLPKLAFQKDQPLPDTLSCRIKGYAGVVPMLIHNVPRYVSEFYADGFSRGEDFEFKVIGVPGDDNGHYRLIDDNGIAFKLYEPKSTLALGQRVKCRFDYLDQNKFNLRRSASDAQFPMFSLRDIAKAAGHYKVNIESIRNGLAEIPEMEKALDDLAHSRSSWILKAVRVGNAVLPRWFKESLDKYSYDRIKGLLNDFRRVTSFLLEGSRFLREVKGKERADLQTEFTSYIENIETYKRALEYINDHRENKFIDQLLDHLKESGYLYHPKEQFSIMMILFRLSPELVNKSLGNIFDTLMGWDPETWMAEPFRQAFAEQLEIYISETRTDIELFLQAETAADTAKIEKVLTAIAIQQALYMSGDRINQQLNMSLFYRYLSLLRSARADVLLDKAYMTLRGVKLPTDFTWSDIKEPTMMMTRATVEAPANAVLPEDVSYYRTADIEIKVGPDGIVVSADNDRTNGVVPNGMLPWPGKYGLQVNVALEKNLNRQKYKTIDGHDEIWAMVEKALFLPEPVAVEQGATRLRAEEGDLVNIIVDYIIPNPYDSNKIEGFRCHIIDPHYIEEDGFLAPEELVSYNLHGVTLGHFRNDKGAPLEFEARVIDVDDNDRLQFSLSDLTYNAVRDLANTGDTSYCVITKDNGRSYSAISEKGFGLYINKFADETTPFHPGNVVIATITGYDNDAVQGVVEDGPIDGFQFNNARAFQNLLFAIANNNRNSDEDDLGIEDEDKLSREDVREIIDILRYKAVSQRDDSIVAFDYLSFARILALTINDTAMADALRAHKEILLQYHHYAKNKQVFRDDIDHILEIAPNSILVQRMASRLGIVAALGHSECNNTLWDIANNAESDIEKQLAQAVLSYNFLCESSGNDDTAAAIKDTIAAMLNVDSEQRKLKYYSSESQYVEFKSSLVYPAAKGRAGISMADPDKQEYEILHIIAGFLNTTGGVLYIGVNDDRYERGLADDFAFYKMDTSERNTKFRHNIKTLDNLNNYLQQLIDTSFNINKLAGEYAKSSIDDEAVKGVLMVKVEPCPHIVKLDDKIYVRHSSKTEPLLRPDEIEMFIADRDRIYKQQVQANSNTTADNTATNNENEVVEEKSIDENSATTNVAEVLPAHNFTIATSSVRNNVLHEWQDPDNFLQAKYYLRFTGDNDLMIVTDEWSIDETERLVLNVHDDEADGYLLMVFENEHALKVPLRELSQRPINIPIQHHDGHKLVFATIAQTDDGLYSLHSNVKNNLYERVTPLDKISQGSISSSPERIMETECATSPLWELVPAHKMSDFLHILSTGMKRTQIGALAKGVNSARTTVEDVTKSIRNRLK